MKVSIPQSVLKVKITFYEIITIELLQSIKHVLKHKNIVSLRYCEKS